MALRPAWKGYLKLSLVTCAVELSNATTQSGKISFRTINRTTGNRLKRQYIDGASGKPVDENSQVKGYEIGGDEFLLIEEEEIEAVQIESSHTMELEGFVDKSEIRQIYLDTPYYLSPADKVSEEAFAVIREALAAKKMAGLARIVLYRRERPVLIEPFGKGMLVTTLRYQNTVRKPDEIFDDLKGVKLDEDMVELAADIVDKKKAKFDPAKFEDHYETALIELVRSKKAGKKIQKAKPETKPSNVVNLFDALRKSLAEDAGKSDDKPGPRKKSDGPDKEKSEKAKPKSSSKSKSA
ncbi:Ku protein [Allomesorhizobium camelthorni]|uniref:Non-homologous end joining protein Ku n=1 Tax=Allomesorhizobium camelthorni TaxID=475069 RepID=A0A6G4WFS8_9HYPH|nr:Ku protein [Mesorhizobium camelthorni]NGO53665.1 Ku protein [Mesorhizobium camelthorni]